MRILGRTVGLDLLFAVCIVAAAYVFVVIDRLREIPNAFLGFGFHPEAVLQASLPIQVHLAAATTALLLGAVQMMASKGTRQHRWLGWVWAGLAISMATSAFLIKERLGALQILSVIVIGMVVRAVWLARRGDVARHSQQMRVLLFGAMLAVGLFTAVPGRVTWNLFFLGRSVAG